MNDRTERIKTIEALIEGSAVQKEPEHVHIRAEYGEVLNVASVSPAARRMLLEVLHSCRAFDSFLKVYVRLHGYKTKREPKSMGDYLWALKENGRIDKRRRKYFQDHIAGERNKYLHEAGIFPSAEDTDVPKLLSEMESFMSEALGLGKGTIQPVKRRDRAAESAGHKTTADIYLID